MKEFRETAYDHISGENFFTLSSSEKKYINRIHKLKEKYPDDVDIRIINPDGSLLVRIPESWCRISPKRQVQMTSEQKIAAKERMLKARQKTIVGIREIGEEKN